MNVTESEREEAIGKLNLTSSLLKLTRGEFIHEDLEFCCYKPKYYLEPENFSPPGLVVIPLWEVDDSITGFYFEDQEPVFIRYYVDYLDDPKVIGRSVKELIEFLVVMTASTSVHSMSMHSRPLNQVSSPHLGHSIPNCPG